MVWWLETHLGITWTAVVLIGCALAGGEGGAWIADSPKLPVSNSGRVRSSVGSRRRSVWVLMGGGEGRLRRIRGGAVVVEGAVAVVAAAVVAGAGVVEPRR
jgi:hypothetical protein